MKKYINWYLCILYFQTTYITYILSTLWRIKLYFFSQVNIKFLQQALYLFNLLSIRVDLFFRNINK